MNDRRKKTELRSFSELYERIAGQGFVPPQALEVEQSVLGAMMIDKVAAQRVIEVLGRTDDDEVSPFYRDEHAAIYRAILALDDAREPIDLLQVTAQLRTKGILGIQPGEISPAYLVEITSKVVTTANVEAHSRLLLEYMIRREHMKLGEELKLRALDNTEDTFDAIEQSDVALYKLNSLRFKKSWRSIRQLSKEVIDDIYAIGERGLEVTGIASELRDLDDITNGWQDEDLIVLGARPSQGKTALALVLARNAALGRNTGVGIFSLEMKASMLMKRLICSESGLNLMHVNRGKLDRADWIRYHEADEKLQSAPIFFDDSAAVTPAEIRSKARRLKQKENIGLVVIDYLQLMNWNKDLDSREREVSKISNALKALAKELQVPVIVLSQLNRGLESRSDKRPMLSDLRDSGSIEQDADLVMLLYRPETYGIAQFDDAKPTAGIAEIIVAKQRNGPIGAVRVAFNATSGDFSDHVFFPDDNRFEQEEIFHDNR